jgi:hypothetical protein
LRPGGGAEYDVVVGLVSWGVGCAYLPGVFSRVSMSYDWIKKTTCAESKDPTGSLCELNRNSGYDNPQASSSTETSVSDWFGMSRMRFELIHFSYLPIFYFPKSPPTFFPSLSPIEQPTSIPSLSSEPTSESPMLEPPPRTSYVSSQKATEPEVSNLQENAVDGVIFEEEEGKAPSNSSIRLGCKIFAFTAVSSMISTWVILQ